MTALPTDGRQRTIATILACVAVAGCATAPNQSVLDPAGPRADSVATLWWFSLSVACAVYVALVGFLAWAAWRARRRAHSTEPLPPSGDRRMTIGVTAAVAVTVVILLVYFGYDRVAGRQLRPPADGQRVFVKVTGNQWWWAVEYPDTNPSRWVRDANEIHIPVRTPILVELVSNDVIHSLWIPSLGGKRDLVPGYRDTVWFQANEPGVYRAQCAEFCGHQHAKMALQVVAHEPEEFRAWLEHARQPAPPPADTLTQRGQLVFLTGPCVMCHAIAGTPAGSHVGPDLTHIGSRMTLAAGTLPNTKGMMAAWIVDPQRLKPGTVMPPNALSPADLEALLAYLRSLK